MEVVRRRRRLATVSIAALVVAACSGDGPDAATSSGGSATPPAEPTPVSTGPADPDGPVGATTAPTTVQAPTGTSTTTPPATPTTSPPPATTVARGPAPACDPPARGGDPVPWDPTATETAVDLRTGSDRGPGVRIAEYQVPDSLGAPWSQWGQGIVLGDGRFLSAVGDHRGIDGRSFVYVYDPAAAELERVIDVQAVVGHVAGATGYGKIHAPMLAGPCGEIYAATYWGSRRDVVDDADYRGDVLLRIDPSEATVTDLGVIYPGHGVASMALSPDGRLLYAEAARPQPEGSGSFVAIDLATGDVVFADDSDEHTGYRSIAVAADGTAYIAWRDGRLARYDPGSNSLDVVAGRVPGGGVLRWATEPLADGSIVAVTQQPNHFFAIGPDGELRDLGPAPGYVTSLAVSPDGSAVYFAPGAHGAGEVSGTIWQLDPSDGTTTELIDVAELADDPLGARLGGSYNLALDPVANRLFVGFNAGDATTEEGSFGRIFLAAIDLPGSTPNATTASTSEATSALVCWSSPVTAGVGPPAGTSAFVDATAELGLVEPLTGMRAHAAAFGDVDGDGWLDVAVGTFATSPRDEYVTRGAAGPSPDTVLLGGPDGFRRDGPLPDALGRTSGAVLVDLDNDGDDDLVLSRNVMRQGGTEAVSAVYERTDDGWRVAGRGLDTASGGRSIGVLDIDRDGLLDLVVTEDRYRGGSSRLYRNLGSLAFVEVGAEVGWPDGVEGFGVATGDLNRDGWTDLFVAGSDRLFLGGSEGLTEVDDDAFETEVFGDEDIVTGADIGDLDGDGWPDLVVGHHYNSTVDFDTEMPVRVYRNTTARIGGVTSFDDVTDAVGSVPLPTKAPHVQIADIDNDGRPDIVTSASAAGGDRPAVLMSVGERRLRFAPPDGLGDDQYWVVAPTVDIDRDGRLDVFALEWDPALPSRMFVNRTEGGHWLQVSVDGAAIGEPVVGTIVEVFESGRSGDDDALLARREIVVSTGYGAGVAPVAHIGLGARTEVDVVVTTPGGRELAHTADADAHLRFPDGCG